MDIFWKYTFLMTWKILYFRHSLLEALSGSMESTQEAKLALCCPTSNSSDRYASIVLTGVRYKIHISTLRRTYASSNC